jgi:hypothetical protein
VVPGDWSVLSICTQFSSPSRFHSKGRAARITFSFSF